MLKGIIFGLLVGVQAVLWTVVGWGLYHERIANSRGQSDTDRLAGRVAVGVFYVLAVILDLIVIAWVYGYGYGK